MESVTPDHGFRLVYATGSNVSDEKLRGPASAIMTAKGLHGVWLVQGETRDAGSGHVGKSKTIVACSPFVRGKITLTAVTALLGLQPRKLLL